MEKTEAPFKGTMDPDGGFAFFCACGKRTYAYTTWGTTKFECHKHGWVATIDVKGS